MDKYIGKLLDNRYEILQVIGTGGMAVVYKALCHRLNRLVAVKILKDEFAKDEEFRNRFHAESQAVAMLSHPNIVAVYDVSRSNSVEYIVMELMDGMTLKQYMDRKGTLSWKEALHFITQILKALNHAHSKGIIHRDIKPHNIMLLRDGSIKVADFGIARFAATQGTLTKEALGSVHYISPEQAKGSHIDARADIYSAGVVLYEMITGRLPYEGDTPVSIAIQHINSMPLNPREINPDIPEALEKITMKAMSASLSKRYRNTDEMLADLEEFRKNPNIQIDYQGIDLEDSQDSEPTKSIGISVSSKSRGDRRDWELDDTGAFDKSTGKKKKSRLPLIAGIITAIVFVTGVITLVTTLVGGGGGNSDVTAPDLVGLRFDEVMEDKKYDDFQIIEDSQEFSDVYDKGEIISQRPAAGRSVKTNSEIHVVISQGPKTVVLSDLKNMTEKQARIEVETRLGLVMDVKYETSDDVLEGFVIRSEPSENTEMKSGDTVTVYVSEGKSVSMVNVPKLIGLSKANALREIEKAGLIAGDVNETASYEDVGTVVYQSLEAGKQVEEKAKIDINISKGTQDNSSNSPGNTSGNTAQSQAGDTGGGTSSAGKSGSPSVPASNTNPGLVSKTIPIKLPASPESFTLTVKVNNVVQYEKVHKASDGTVNVTIKGRGNANVKVYINNTLYNETTVTF